MVSMCCEGAHPILRIHTVEGYSLDLTPNQTIQTINRGVVAAKQLVYKDKIAILDSPFINMVHAKPIDFVEGVVLGFATVKSYTFTVPREHESTTNQQRHQIYIKFEEGDGEMYNLIERWHVAMFDEPAQAHSDPRILTSMKMSEWLKQDTVRLYASTFISSRFGYQKVFPRCVLHGSSEMMCGFLVGFLRASSVTSLDADHTCTDSIKILSSISDLEIKTLQHLLLYNGVRSKISEECPWSAGYSFITIDSIALNTFVENVITSFSDETHAVNSLYNGAPFIRLMNAPSVTHEEADCLPPPLRTTEFKRDVYTARVSYIGTLDPFWRESVYNIDPCGFLTLVASGMILMNMQCHAPSTYWRHPDPTQISFSVCMCPSETCPRGY
jgi:hypothetical protein